MSAVSDNQTFLTNVLGAGNVDFEGAVYGLWVSVFRNVNHSSNGYSYPEPLVSDIMSIDYSLTGKTFTAFNREGKAPDVRFFITSGVKGSAFYDTNTIAADITDSFISGESPSIIMSGQGFTGDVYRKYEVTGLVNSLVSSFQSLSVSGEDWTKTSIGISANSAETEFVDSDYSGYANEVQTRYKFLFTDASNSIQEDLSIFDIPTQIEAGASLRYRISRKSDPLGTYVTPQVTADNKMIIDYSQYQDVIPVAAETSLDYNFKQSNVTRLSEKDLLAIKDDYDIKNITIGDGGDIVGLKVSAEQSNSQIAFTILPSQNQSFDDIYKIDFSIDRFNETSKRDIDGYVLTTTAIDGESSIVTSLSVGDKVYPRNIQSDTYDQAYLRELANLSELEYNEKVAQGEDPADEPLSDNTTLENSLEAYSTEINNLYSEDTEASYEEVGVLSKDYIDSEQNEDQYSENNSNGLLKFVLPTLSLPKDKIDKGYYSNYLNSGESYIALPLVEYSSDPSLVYYGNQIGGLAYYIDENEFRSSINSTAGGITIGATGVCIGDSAIDANAYSDEILFYNGRDLNIDPDGVIKKSNFIGADKRTNSVNYFYAKNNLYSFDIYPENTDESNQAALANGLGQAAGLLNGEGQFLNKNPRMYLEREIYVEEYDENQAQLVSELFKPAVDNTANVELTTHPNEKLYAIQTYSSESSSPNFLQSFDYQENITFNKFIPYSAVRNSSYVQNNFYSYVDSDNKIARLKCEAENSVISDSQIARLEYVMGSSFSYAALSSNYAVWSGTATNGQVTLSSYSEDISSYAYHLYGYNSTSENLTFIQANVRENASNPISVPSSLANFCVLKFAKKSFTKAEYYIEEGDSKYLAFNFLVLENNTTVANPANVFFNIQIYDYTVSNIQTNTAWFTNKDNPYNDDYFGADNIYGDIIPRFFDDGTDNEDKRKALELLNYPNGPASSKNFEGITVSNEPAVISSLLDGTIKNKLRVIEGDRREYESSTDFMLDFNIGGQLVKGRKVNSDEPRKFLDTKRLKITRVRYNIYSKDLVILGDAGFQYSVELNTAWEYKLQYKPQGGSWTELSNSVALTNKDLQVTSEFLNPFFYVSRDLSKRAYLSTVAFRTNMPRFLDDSEYEFRIFKYEKLVSPFNSVDIINKTNFLPINVSWNSNASAEYYNIYQVDSDDNQTLLETVSASESSSYALPRIKQSYFDLGPSNFSAGLGYYNILVSGVDPAIDNSNLSVDSTFSNFKVGDDIGGQQYSVNVTQNNANYNNQYSAVSNVSYSPVIDFRNEEAKQSAFTIDQKYDNYYFVTNSQNATLSNVTSDFEAYIVNTGSASCTLTHGGGTTSMANGAGVYINGSTVSAISFTEASSFKVSLDDAQYALVNSDASTDTTLSQGVEYFIINDSDSSIDFTFNNNGPTTKTIPANQTKSFERNGSSIDDKQTFSNINQNLNTLETSSRTVSLDFSSMTITSDVTALPIYNFNKIGLNVNSSITISPDTLALVSKSGATLSKTEISSFDRTKIYFDGLEEERFSNYMLVDDTDIIISNFNIESEREYYFFASQVLTRTLNIRILNGNSIEKISPDYSSFKLTVFKVNGNVNYKISLPKNNLEFNLSSDSGQMIAIKEKPLNLLGSDISIDINLREAQKILKTNSFSYISNKSSVTLNLALPNNSVPIFVSQNQIYRVSLNQVDENINNQLQVVEVNPAKLRFDFTKYADFSSSSNIHLFNLRFNNTKLTLGDSSFNGDAFIILKNTIVPNSIGIKLLNGCNIYRLTNSLEAELPVFKNSTDSVFENIYDSVNDYNFIYIDDDNLKNITIRDSFGRDTERKGFIVSKESRELSAKSFDNIYNFNLNKGQVFTYKFDQGAAPDGSLSVKNKKVDFNILNESSLSEAVSVNGQALIAGAFFVNLTLTEVTLSGLNKIYKNRIADHSFNVYPLFNKEEFFIAKRSAAGTFYYDVEYDCDVDKIVWDPTSSSTSIVRNFSSKIVTLVNIKTNTENTISPNKKVTITTSVANSQPIGNNEEANGFKILYSNQAKEIQSDYPINNNQLTTSDFFKNNKDVDGKQVLSVNLKNPNVNNLAGYHCFGLSLGSDDSPLKGNILNDLYLKVYVDGTGLGYGQVKYEGNTSVVNFNRLKRVNVDLASVFTSANFTNSVEIIPFYRELVSFSLPNPANFANKKILFVNMVKCGENAENKVLNNFLPIPEEEKLTEFNSVKLFSSNGSEWSLVSTEADIPVIQNLHASAEGISAANFSGGAISQNGSELLEVNNIDTLRITLDSFTKGAFGSFFLYNPSGADSINLITGDRVPVSYPVGTFNKIEFDGGSYRVKPIFYSQSNQYLDVDSVILSTGFSDTSYDYERFWEDTYPTLPVGTTFLINQTLRKKVFNTERIDDAISLPIANKLPNQGDQRYGLSNMVNLLRVDKLINESDKFFVYGSSVRNELGNSFQSYDLQLAGVSNINESFFVFNNTQNDLRISFSDIGGGSVRIPKFTMYEITKNSMYPFDSRRKNEYFVSRDQSSASNFIIKQNLPVVKSSKPAYIITNNSEILLEESPQYNEIIITCNSNNTEFIDTYGFYYDSEGSSREFYTTLIQDGEGNPLQLKNPYIYYFKELSNFNNTINSAQPSNLLKISYDVSAAGHYLINNSEVQVNISSQSSADHFLINNTSKDLSVFFGDQIKTLYANNVLVFNGNLNSSTYLKKGKNEDEFYAVFNPKTKISTQREVADYLGLETYSEISAIYNSDFIRQSSYIKLFSNDGSSDFVYLNEDQYYAGVSIPTDTIGNVVAYEVGVGHETIYKFKFIDKSSNFYTLPGITNGDKYKVEIDNDLLWNQSIIKRLSEKDSLKGQVKYMGEVIEPGKTFTGGASPWYEVNYPEYVKVYKVIEEFPEGFSAQKWKDSVSEEYNGLTQDDVLQAEQGEVVANPLALFKEKLKNDLSSTLTESGKPLVTIIWIPEDDQNAFWLNDSYSKNLWEIQQVIGDTIEIEDPSNSLNKLIFTKCKMKTESLRSPVSNFSFSYYSALQDRIFLSQGGDVTAGFDYNLTPNQVNRLKGLTNAEYNKLDLIDSSGKQATIAYINSNILNKPTEPQLKDSKIEISIRVSRITEMPQLSLEDFSQNGIVKLLNSQP